MFKLEKRVVWWVEIVTVVGNADFEAINFAWVQTIDLDCVQAQQPYWVSSSSGILTYLKHMFTYKNKFIIKTPGTSTFHPLTLSTFEL